MRRIRKYKEPEYYFYFDALTGIWNRYYFGKYDEEYCDSKERYSVGALYFSLAGIREINETQGFQRGNQVIQAFAEMLAVEFGKNACYRMDGSEFLVLLEHFEEEDARAEFEAIEELLQAGQLTRVSVGYAWSAEAERLEEVVLQAEKEMLQREGKQRAEVL